MKKTTLLTMTLAMVALVLTGCGTGGAKVAGKDGAAQAVYAMTGASKTGANRATGGIDLSDASATCAKGGTVKLSAFKTEVDLSDGASVVLGYNMTFTNCGLVSSDQGDALYNGTVAVSQKVVTGAAGVKVEQAFKGTVTLAGAFNDTLAVDVKQSVNVTDMGQSGSVSIVLVGSATTSSGTYSWDGSVTVTGGTIAAEVTTSK
jgi:predicted small secreted protein